MKIKFILNTFTNLLIIAHLFGCSPGTLSKTTHLPTNIKQTYFLDHPVEEVWSAIKEEMQSLQNSKILILEEEEFLASWITAIHSEKKTGISNNQHMNPLLNHKRSFNSEGSSTNTESSLLQINLFENDLSEVLAITTVLLWEKHNGAEMQIRRVYYPTNSAQGISHSRGMYEQKFSKKISMAISSSP